MTDEVYLFDSYAFIEISEGNLNYKEYAKATALTTKLNIFEVYYNLLKQGLENQAKLFLKNYYDITIDFDNIVIANAAKLKLQNKQLSMADCIGYMLANKIGVKFLTGDKEFENLDNVEFVK